MSVDLNARLETLAHRIRRLEVELEEPRARPAGAGFFYQRLASDNDRAAAGT
ncbi:MAG: hypothetical protein ICV59_04915 [Thermoleophilia bacterium]|nr:hypothetical protein [Thermoleophilia bacterium]